MNYLNDVEIGLMEKDDSIKGLENVPDAMMTVFASNKLKFAYRLQVNDMSWF
jgi:hypothetical protein